MNKIFFLSYRYTLAVVLFQSLTFVAQAAAPSLLTSKPLTGSESIELEKIVEFIFNERVTFAGNTIVQFYGTESGNISYSQNQDAAVIRFLAQNPYKPDETVTLNISHLLSPSGENSGPFEVSFKIRARRPPVIHAMSTGVKSSRGLVWLSAGISDADYDDLKINLAEAAWNVPGRPGDFIQILDEEMSAVTFKSKPSQSQVAFTWRLPEALLEETVVDLWLRFRLSDGTHDSEIFTLFEPSVQVQSLREKGWFRTKEGLPLIATFVPGNYLHLDYYGGSLRSSFGEAINMGMVEVQVDGNVIVGSPVDNYAHDIPIESAPTVVVDTRFIEKELYEDEEDSFHRVRMEVLKEKNIRATETGLALAYFKIHQDPTRRVGPKIIRDIEVSDARIKLFSVPALADPEIFNILGLVGTQKSRQKSAVAPGGTSGYRVYFGPWLGKQSPSDFFALSDYTWPSMKKDTAYYLKLHTISSLGLESLVQIRALLFDLSEAAPANSEGSLKLEKGSLSFTLTPEEKGAFAEGGILSNEGLFPEFSKSSIVLIPQGKSRLTGYDFTLDGSSPQLLGKKVFSYSPENGQWSESTWQSGQSFKSQSLVLIEVHDENEDGETNLQLSGGGGGCLLK